MIQEKFTLSATRAYDYDPETWMSRMTHARMWELVVPCAHDSLTSRLKNYLVDPVKRFIKTQSVSVAD
jgi:hypothetical protein